MGSGGSSKQNDQYIQMTSTCKCPMQDGAPTQLKMAREAKEHSWHEIQEGDPRRSKP